MTILHLDSSITGEASVSRQVSAAIVSALAAANPTQVVHRDLASDPLPHFTLEALADRSVLEEFLAADTVVIGAPMYNFTLPTQLKAWIDRILVAGTTFRYGEDGRPQGLAGGKRVIVALARGGFYANDSATRALEHLETYLDGVFGFIGIKPEFVIAEGIATGPDGRTAALESALAQAGEATAKLAA